MRQNFINSNLNIFPIILISSICQSLSSNQTSLRALYLSSKQRGTWQRPRVTHIDSKQATIDSGPCFCSLHQPNWSLVHRTRVYIYTCNRCTNPGPVCNAKRLLNIQAERSPIGYEEYGAVEQQYRESDTSLNHARHLFDSYKVISEEG